jgi:hypothetical protein
MERVLIAVSTCNRPKSYLAETLASFEPGIAQWMDLVNKGEVVPTWRQNTCLVSLRIAFFDGPAPEIYFPHGWSGQPSRQSRGTRENLWEAFRTAVDHPSRCDRLLYFEDDVILQGPWALARMATCPILPHQAFLSFHDMKDLPENSPAGIYDLPLTGADGRGFWGLQAVAFPRRTFEYLAPKNPYSLRTKNPRAEGDRVVEEFLQQSPWPGYGLHCPSLVQHIGEVSVAHPDQPLASRATRNVAGMDFRCPQLGARKEERFDRRPKRR